MKPSVSAVFWRRSMNADMVMPDGIQKHRTAEK
jgi:hypothetical protein